MGDSVPLPTLQPNEPADHIGAERVVLLCQPVVLLCQPVVLLCQPVVALDGPRLDALEISAHLVVSLGSDRLDSTLLTAQFVVSCENPPFKLGNLGEQRLDIVTTLVRHLASRVLSHDATTCDVAWSQRNRRSRRATCCRSESAVATGRLPPLRATQRTGTPWRSSRYARLLNRRVLWEIRRFHGRNVRVGNPARRGAGSPAARRRPGGLAYTGHLQPPALR